ncbi:MAG: GTPase HflX, partial [bacterium]|nr:GTPase HflX [bacterium]
EDLFGIRVIGRTELIFDIFSKRAMTNEAKIQVELAQLKYIMPRLTGFGIALSRLGGGIGTRGPGEKKLETDRRHIARRIHTLEKKLKDIEKHHRVITSNRNHKVVSLVGYTNAGKTTLLNSLAREDLKTENRLFVTLDTTTRKIFLEQEKFVLVSDTVGFIRDLPHYLVASFRTTLKEVKDSDLVLHVIDLSESDFMKKIGVVNNVLAEMEVDLTRVISVFNKTDRVGPEKLENIRREYPDSLFISAKEKINLEKLKKYILFRTDI